MPNLAPTQEGMDLTSRFQTRPADKKPINILLGSQITTVLFRHTSAVDDPCSLLCIRGDCLPKPVSDGGVHFLRLFCGGDFARADCPV